MYMGNAKPNPGWLCRQNIKRSRRSWNVNRDFHTMHTCKGIASSGFWDSWTSRMHLCSHGESPRRGGGTRIFGDSVPAIMLHTSSKQDNAKWKLWGTHKCETCAARIARQVQRVDSLAFNVYFQMKWNPAFTTLRSALAEITRQLANSHSSSIISGLLLVFVDPGNKCPMGNRSSHHRRRGIGIGNATDKISPLRRWSLGSVPSPGLHSDFCCWPGRDKCLFAGTLIASWNYLWTGPAFGSVLVCFGLAVLGLPFGLSFGLPISECRQITRTVAEWQCS